MRICGKHEVGKVAAESLCRPEHALKQRFNKAIIKFCEGCINRAVLYVYTGLLLGLF